MDVNKRNVISAGMDASGIKTGMAEAAAAVTQSTSQMARALLDTGRGFETLARNFVSGYREATQFAQGIQNAYRALGDGRDRLGLLPGILDSISAKYNIMGEAARRAALTMGDATATQAQRLQAFQSLITAGAAGTATPGSATAVPAAMGAITTSSRAAQFAMRDFGLQAIDVFQGLASGAPVLTTLIQQGAQVAQVNAAMGVGFRQMAAGIGDFIKSLVTNPITLFIGGITALVAAMAALVTSSQNTAERLGTLRNQLSASRDDAEAMTAQVEAAARHLAQTTTLGFTEASKAAADFARNPAFVGTQRQQEAMVNQAHRLALVLGVDLPAATKILERGLDDAAGAAQILLDDKSHFGSAAGVTQAWVDSLKNLNQAQAFQALIDKITEVTAKGRDSFTNLGAAWQRFLQLVTGDGPGFWSRVGGHISDGLAAGLRAINAVIEAFERLRTAIGRFLPWAQNGGTLIGNMFGDPSGTPRRADTAMSGDREHDLAIIRQRESGNQNKLNEMGPGGTPLSTASGHYQIIDPTWREGAAMAGVDLQRYKRAIEAPFEVQHQVAQALYDRYGATPWAASAPRGMNAAGTIVTEQQAINEAQNASKQALQRRIDENAAAQRVQEEGIRAAQDQAARARERATTAPGGVEGPDYKAATADYETALRAGISYHQQLVELKKAQYDLIDPQQKMARSLEESLRPMQAQEGMTRRLAEVEQQYRDEAKGTGIDLEALSRARAATLASGTREIRDQVTALDIQTNSLRAQIPQMEEGGMVAERAAAFERAIVEARKAAIPGTRQHQQVVEDLTEAYRREIEVKRDMQAATDIAASTRELEILATEARLISATTAERERELAVLRERQSLGLTAGDVANQEMQRAINQKALSATRRAEIDLEKQSYNELASATEQAFNQIGSSITDAIMSGNASAVTFLNIWKSVVAQIIQEAIKLSVLNPILNSLFPGTQHRSTAFDVVNALAGIGGGLVGGGFVGGGALGMSATGAASMGAGGEMFASGGIFAKGGVFHGSDLAKYSNIVIDQPTLFHTGVPGFSAYAQGGIGLAGESGAEAIMPLTRTASGHLGIRSDGGGGGNTHVNTTINVNASPGAGQDGKPAMDPKALSELQRQLDQTVRNAVRATMADQRRPGGDLWR